MDRADRNRVAESIEINGLDDPKLKSMCQNIFWKIPEEVEMARELLPTLDPQAVLEGHMTPIWFGS